MAMKAKTDKPIKSSVFLPRKVHKTAAAEADKSKVSLSKWIAQLVADRLGVSLDNGNGATYY